MNISMRIFAGLFLYVSGLSFVSADLIIPEKAGICASCHGALGVSNYDLWPNIAGQKQGYLLRQLNAFRDGSREDPWMTPMATPLSDDEIKELADFFSAL